MGHFNREHFLLFLAVLDTFLFLLVYFFWEIVINLPYTVINTVQANKVEFNY